MPLEKVSEIVCLMSRGVYQSTEIEAFDFQTIQWTDWYENIRNQHGNHCVHQTCTHYYLSRQLVFMLIGLRVSVFYFFKPACACRRLDVLLRVRRPPEPASWPPGRLSPGDVGAGTHGSGIIKQKCLLGVHEKVSYRGEHLESQCGDHNQLSITHRFIEVGLASVGNDALKHASLRGLDNQRAVFVYCRWSPRLAIKLDILCGVQNLNSAQGGDCITSCVHVTPIAHNQHIPRSCISVGVVTV